MIDGKIQRSFFINTLILNCEKINLTLISRVARGWRRGRLPHRILPKFLISIKNAQILVKKTFNFLRNMIKF